MLNAVKQLREERQRGMSDVIRRVHQLRLIKEGAEFVGVNVSNSSKTVTSDRVFWQPVVSWFLFSLSYSKLVALFYRLVDSVDWKVPFY